ncbi:MAG TPA: ABC transporter substrate-binding protein [Synergistaceae bacterium]|nr:ABC transporter substrate-binding protein [Synergistaceae bacterium]HQH77769.1 ABC transporter substrate-binding protein [Synergistaceae bacterium]HQK24931.1 ABC transporter substrate-binding protein [Synergistaceae bacterium]
MALLVLWVGAGWALSLDDVRHRGVLRIGLEDEPWGFFVRWQEGVPEGLCADLARALAKALGVREEIVAVPWGEGEPGSITGTWQAEDWSRFDVVVSPVAIMAERQGKVTFSLPYTTVGQMILVRRNGGARAPENLRLGRIGVAQGTSSVPAAQEAFPDATLVPYDGGEALATPLRQKEIDAVVVDSPVALDFLRRFSDIVALEKLLTRERYALVLPLSADRSLVEAVNGFLSGEGKAIVDRWSRGDGGKK